MLLNGIWKRERKGTSLGVQWLGLRAPNAGGLGSIPGQETRCPMLQRKIPHSAAKTWCSQINVVFFLKKERERRKKELFHWGILFSKARSKSYLK